MIYKLFYIYDYEGMTSIKDYENYIIFEDGKVINTDTGIEMKPKIDKGYYRIGLRKDGKRKDFLIHRLIALSFIPNPDNKPFIDHINRDRKDNRIENLRWATRIENSRNQSCKSNTGKQFISKKINKTSKQGFYYRFQIQRPELKIDYTNKDLEPVIEFRNKFCAENNIEINDA